MTGRSLARRGAQEPTLQWSRRHRRAAPTPPSKKLPQHRQPTRIHSPAASLSARATPVFAERAKAYIVTRVLRRCSCAIHSIASAAMPVRRGARPGREHHHTTRTWAPHLRSSDARRRIASRNAGVVGVASKHSESSRTASASGLGARDHPSRPVLSMYVRRRGRIASGPCVQRSDQRGPRSC